MIILNFIDISKINIKDEKKILVAGNGPRKGERQAEL
jgi:hypothetical protein